MMLGNRHRPPIKRTTSMTEFTLDINNPTTVGGGHDNPQPPHDPNNPFNTNPPPNGSLDHRFFSATISPRNHRRHSMDHMETAPFLTVCHLCNRRLIPGRDIFMYRGNNAFCSLECRQEQYRGLDHFIWAQTDNNHKYVRILMHLATFVNLVCGQRRPVIVSTLMIITV